MTNHPASIDVRFAAPDDVLAIAALHLRLNLESATERRPGFLTEYANTWLATPGAAADVDRELVGVVLAALVTKLLILRYSANTLGAHLASAYRVPDLRGARLGCHMLETVIDWCVERAVSRVPLHPSKKARNFYERIIFDVLNSRLMELKLTQTR